MKNFKLTIEYDGSRYSGWQRLGKGESTNTIEQAAHRQSAHFATACTTVRVVLTAACAV